MAIQYQRTHYDNGVSIHEKHYLNNNWQEKWLESKIYDYVGKPKGLHVIGEWIKFSWILNLSLIILAVVFFLMSEWILMTICIVAFLSLRIYQPIYVEVPVQKLSYQECEAYKTLMRAGGIPSNASPNDYEIKVIPNGYNIYCNVPRLDLATVKGIQLEFERLLSGEVQIVPLGGGSITVLRKQEHKEEYREDSLLSPGRDIQGNGYDQKPYVQKSYSVMRNTSNISETNCGIENNISSKLSSEAINKKEIVNDENLEQKIFRTVLEDLKQIAPNDFQLKYKIYEALSDIQYHGVKNKNVLIVQDVIVEQHDVNDIKYIIVVDSKRCTIKLLEREILPC